MNQETIYEEIKAIITIDSYKAIRVDLTREGRFLWIPKSLINNIEDIDLLNNYEEQILEVARWFVLQNNITNSWY